MIIPINLASQPFRHDRALLIGSSVLAAIMVASLVMLIQLARIDQKNKVESWKQLAIAQKQLALVQRDESVIEQELRKPQNKEVLEYSVLLNDILRRKGISWTRIFADLEKVVPYNVRVLQIRPQLDNKDRVFLQMTIGADQTAQLNAFLERLEASDAFGATTVPAKIPPSQTDPLFRYQVNVFYAQKL
jgi:hypothetical protein